jgi:YidC/Oxa1 family membrane protein insertase
MLLSANIFQPLIDVFQSVIEFFHNDVGASWGLSIVFLTISVRLVLVPLMLKQFHSMQAMQAHMPELKALQAKYKEDKQRQQQEVMKFYQENKINPLASCLPLVAQLPVFISLFYMLRKNLRADICGPYLASTYERLHPGTTLSRTKQIAQQVAATATKTNPGGACQGHGHSGFLFIHDLTAQATGFSLIVLLVLYVGTQMGTQVIMAQPTMDQNMRRMMMFLPLLFIAFVYRFPAGVLVYWVTTNTWMLLQQAAFKARIGRLRASGKLPTPVVATAGAAGKTGGGSAGKSGTEIDYANLGNGGGSGAGLGRLLRPKAATVVEPVKPVRTGPPPSSRKKKKRSGRRR